MPQDGVSRVVETKYGFHILRRSPPPPALDVAGQRLVVRYAGNTNSEVFGTSTRTRAEAIALARALKNSGEDFTALVKGRSESADRIRAGDIGVWSTRAPEYNGAEVEALAGVSVGSITEPVDSPIGIQILKRTPVDPRPELAASAIQLRYDPTVKPDGPNGKQTALHEALALIDTLRKSPADFDQMREIHCCQESWQWRQGAGEPELEQITLQLAMGEIATRPADTGWFYLIPRRIEPSQQASSLQYDLPSPERPDMAAILRQGDGRVLANGIAALRRAAQQSFRLPASEQTRLDALLERFQRALSEAQTLTDRELARQAVLQGLHRDFDATTAQTFLRFFEAWATARALEMRR